jgi:hypothetical protein
VDNQEEVRNVIFLHYEFQKRPQRLRVNVGAGTERIHRMLLFEERKRGGSKEIKFAPKKDRTKSLVKA